METEIFKLSAHELSEAYNNKTLSPVEVTKSIIDRINNIDKDINAFGILGVSVGLKWRKIQDKFKVLVKKFHPDMNSGNKKFEEKLKIVTLAYTHLKLAYKGKK